MFSWIWILVAGWAGFILGFMACSLFAINRRSDKELEELEVAAKEYYKL